MQHTQYSWAEEQIPQLQVMVKRAKLEHHSPARDQQPDTLDADGPESNPRKLVGEATRGQKMVRSES